MTVSVMRRDQSYDVPVYGVIMLSPKGRYLLVKGAKTGKWSFPKGHLEIRLRETPYECAIRELREETGIVLPGLKPTLGPVKLMAASYYVFRPASEIAPVISDLAKNEISDAQWFSLHEIKNLLGNVDVSTFLKKHGIRPTPPRVVSNHYIIEVPSFI